MNKKTFSKFLILTVLLGLLGTTFVAPHTYAQNPTDCEPSDSSDWELYEGEGVTVLLPEANWQVISDDELETAADIGTEFMSDEMAFLAMFGSDQGDVLAVNSISNPTLSLLVTVMPIPSDEITVDNIAALMGLDALEAFGMIIAEPRLTDLQSGEAYVIDVAFEEESITLPISIFERFYLVLGEENIYMVLFVTEEDQIKDLCGDVAAIADSFTFDESVVPEAVAVADANWISHTGEFVSISAPDTWLDASDPSFIDMAIELAGENNPLLENVMNQFSPDLFDLFLVDPLVGVTVNVIAQDLGISIPIDLLIGEMETQYTQVLGADVISIEQVEIPAGDALRAQITLDVVDLTGTTTTQEQVQYIVIDGTWLYVVSMGGPQTLFEEYEAVYEQIAQSIELLN